MIKILNLNKVLNINVNNCEFFAIDGSSCPSGSIKDITVMNMLSFYKEKGMLNKQTTIIEATSGNTGISLAYYSKEYGYHTIIVLPTNASNERKLMIKAFGATVIEVSGGMKECDEKANELKDMIPNSFIFSQFICEANPDAHYKVTAPELNKEIKDIDYIFAGIGTGGTISGIGKFYKTNKIDTKIIGVEPFESPLITKGVASSHLIQGIGANFIPSTFLKEYVDDVITVKGLESIQMAKKINESKKIFVGYSSGANLLAAIEYIKIHNINNKKIVVVFPDKGDRYSW